MAAIGHEVTDNKQGLAAAESFPKRGLKPGSECRANRVDSLSAGELERPLAVAFVNRLG